MAWVLLFCAGALEIGWAVGLKYADGFTKPVSTLFTMAAMMASLILLGLAVRSIPIGTGYAIWTGIGAAGTAVAGMILFNEPASWPRIACVLLILLGVAGLKLVG